MGAFINTLKAIRVPPCLVCKDVSVQVDSFADACYSSCPSQAQETIDTVDETGRLTVIESSGQCAEPVLPSQEGQVRPGSLSVPPLMDFVQFSKALVGDVLRLEVTQASAEDARIYTLHARIIEQLPYFNVEARRRKDDVAKVLLPVGVKFLTFEALLYRCYYGSYPQFLSQTFGDIMSALSLSEYFLATAFQAELQQQLLDMSAAICDDDVCQVASEAFVQGSLVASAAMESLVAVHAKGMDSDILIKLIDKVMGRNSDHVENAWIALQATQPERAQRGWGPLDAANILTAIRDNMWQQIGEMGLLARAG